MVAGGGLKDVTTNSEYGMSNDKPTKFDLLERWFEVNGRGVLDKRLWSLRRGTEENHEKL
jgi:hypothetical protein